MVKEGLVAKMRRMKAELQEKNPGATEYDLHLML
jgi:hypothetical protein